ncbi:MAG: Ig-like domain-containing protein, partial [Clostridia bacterium]|nr:Ig-like domain-containing protein [Clostridia bacterium]
EFASIDENGVLTGIKVGSVKLTATVHNFATDTDVTGECMVNVVPGPHRIVFENTRTTIGYLETMMLNPVAYNENGDVVETEFTYTSSKNGYVSLKGNSIYGKSKGVSVITATAENGVSASVTITTVSAPTKVTISADSVNLAVGESTQARFAFPSGQDGSVTWKAENSSILSIDKDGVVTALAKGSTRIRVDSYNKKYALLTINVVDAPESIAFEKAVYQIGEGESFKPVLTALPVGASTNAAFEVIGDELITVSENGTVTAGTTLGTATLRATVHNFVTNENVVCECQIEVVSAPVTIEFRNLRTAIGYSETVDLEPYALNGRGEEVETTFKLTSSKTNYVSIKNGRIYGSSKGTAIITVTAANGAKREISVQTMASPSKVTVSAESAILAVGESIQMVASFPSGQAGAVTWKVENSEILSIDENGIVTALSKGTTRVRADSYNKKNGMVTVTVGDAPESIAFEKAAYQLGEGETMKAVVLSTPEGTSANASFEIVSGSELATVDQYGYVTAGTELGTLTLRATVHNYVENTDVTAECAIEIVPAVVSIQFGNARETIGYSETVNLEPYALDGRGNIIETTFKLSSSKTNYVSIKNGNVYGAYRGKAVVTVTAENGVSAQLSIETVSAPSKVTVSAPSTRISVGESIQLSYTLPSGQDGKVTWKVEDADILSVDGNGFVTALKKGTTRVRVDTYNKKYALVSITVADAPDAIVFDKAEYTVSEGCVRTVSFTAQPAGASTNVTYSLIGEEYASVDENGRITGILEGKATLRATVHNYVTGLDVVGECTINVVPGPASIRLMNTRTTIGYLETIDLEPVAYDKNGNVVPTTFTYASSSS